MEINKLNELNPDDLDMIFRGISLYIDQKENDLEVVIQQMVDKYKNYELQDHDKKLLHRFSIRVSELLEKCKNQNAITYILSIRDLLGCKTQNFAVILNKVHKTSQQQYPTEETNQVQMKKSIPTWQINNQKNKALAQYFENDFWKLYDIMLLNKQYCNSLIVFHQSKQENIERLYILSLERNQRFLQSHSQPQIEASTLMDKAKKLKFLQLNQTVETPYSNKNMTMFGTQSPNKRTHTSVKQSISISPQRALSRDHQAQEPDFRSIFDVDNSNIFDSNFKVTRTKNLSLHNDKNIMNNANNQFRQKTRSKLQQENFSPQKGVKNQNWVLPEIKSPNQFDQNESIIKPIQILQNSGQSPEKRNTKKPPLPQDLNSTLCQQLLPQYRTNARAFQTIRSLIRK